LHHPRAVPGVRVVPDVRHRSVPFRARRGAFRRRHNVLFVTGMGTRRRPFSPGIAIRHRCVVMSADVRVTGM
jgi:hypothetical protein